MILVNISNARFSNQSNSVNQGLSRTLRSEALGQFSTLFSNKKHSWVGPDPYLNSAVILISTAHQQSLVTSSVVVTALWGSPGPYFKIAMMPRIHIHAHLQGEKNISAIVTADTKHANFSMQTLVVYDKRLNYISDIRILIRK